VFADLATAVVLSEPTAGCLTLPAHDLLRSVLFCWRPQHVFFGLFVLPLSFIYFRGYDTPRVGWRRCGGRRGLWHQGQRARCENIPDFPVSMAKHQSAWETVFI
jgi:hypothetical protein